MGYKTINKKLGEKMTADDVNIQGWKKCKMIIDHLCLELKARSYLTG